MTTSRIRELGLPTNQVVWTTTSVGPARLKSAPAKVTRRDGRYTVIGVAWGAPIQRVEVKIDDRLLDADHALRTTAT